MDVRTTAEPGMRLFVAAYPSVEALDDLAAFVSTLGMARYAAENNVNVRIAARNLWHVTLAFLGEVPGERLDAAATALDEATTLDEATALDEAATLDKAAMAQAYLRIGGGGKFGRGRFTIVWVGLRGDVDSLAATARSVRARLRKARLPYDEKPFRPHLTLARPSSRAPDSIVASDVMALDMYEGPEWACDEICLVSSQQGPKPAHEIIHRAKIVQPGV